MAQTPARDFIKSAVVDFRFCNGDTRNYANNANVLATTGFVPTIHAAHGVPALTYTPGPADQTWMLAGQDECTIEALISLDMLHLGEVGTNAETVLLLGGEWRLGFYVAPGTGQQTRVVLWASLNNQDFTDDYIIKQDLSSAVVTSLHKGSPLHVVLSAKYIAATSFQVTTCVNGVVSAETTLIDYAEFEPYDSPVNTLFGGAVQCPVYLFRMWDAFEGDAGVLAELYQEARKLFPTAAFVAPTGAVDLTVPS
jgi:hypothetical protein